MSVLINVLQRYASYVVMQCKIRRNSTSNSRKLVKVKQMKCSQYKPDKKCYHHRSSTFCLNYFLNDEAPDTITVRMTLLFGNLTFYVPRPCHQVPFIYFWYHQVFRWGREVLMQGASGQKWSAATVLFVYTRAEIAKKAWKTKKRKNPLDRYSCVM